jgi:hypothetical protein
MLYLKFYLMGVYLLNIGSLELICNVHEHEVDAVGCLCMARTLLIKNGATTLPVTAGDLI